jgi:hypothetical protein
MLWLVAVGAVLVTLAIAWLVFGRRQSDRQGRDSIDPLARVGMAFAIAGAVTIPTLGPVMLVMTSIGIVLMVVANHRSGRS